MPLHFGRMPHWFTEHMGEMTKAVIESVVQNYGKSELLTRMSDPNWFQALGAVAGMQYNSSGVTAAVLGSVRRKINPMASELGVHILGGKGKAAWRAPRQIEQVADQVQQMLAGIRDIADIFVVAPLAAEGAEGLQLDNIGETDDCVQRRAQLVAHMGQEIGFRQVGDFGILLGLA